MMEGSDLEPSDKDLNDPVDDGVSSKVEVEEAESHHVASLTSRHERKDHFLELCRHNCTVVIDCEFDCYENEKEASSLARQLMQSYAYNKRAEKPVNLVICGIQEKSYLAQAFEKISGTENWACVIDSRSLEELFDVSKVTYLSADAEETLDDISQDGIYVIGGIVDRNRLKGISLNRSKHIGAVCKRLPIREHVKLSHSHVLSVTACINIFLNYTLNRDWKKALTESIPKRKF